MSREEYHHKKFSEKALVEIQRREGKKKIKVSREWNENERFRLYRSTK